MREKLARERSPQRERIQWNVRKQAWIRLTLPSEGNNLPFQQLSFLEILLTTQPKKLHLEVPPKRIGEYK